MTCPSQDAVDVAAPTQHAALALLMSNQDLPCGHAPSIMQPPRNGAQSDMGARLESVRRRLSNPEPGTVQKLRQEQRELIHAILSRGA